MLCVCESGKILGWGKGVVGDFSEEFVTGSDIVCFVPRELSSFDITPRLLLRNVK